LISHCAPDTENTLLAARFVLDYGCSLAGKQLYSDMLRFRISPWII